MKEKKMKEKKDHFLADRIFELRKKNRFTQEDLAKKLGITPQSVSRWENGQSRPDVDMLPQIAAIFDTDIDALFGYRTKNLLITRYEDQFKESDKGYYQNGKIIGMARSLLELVPPTKPVNILEIGCGEGNTSVFFARNGYIVSAFDISQKALDKGKKLAESVGVNVNFFRADIANYQLETDFDIIYSSGTFQYLRPEDRKNFFKMIQDHTVTGGINAFNAFVEKSFIPSPPDWKPEMNYFDSAELYSYYGKNWKLEVTEEVCFNCAGGGKPHRHCINKMIARKMGD